MKPEQQKEDFMPLETVVDNRCTLRILQPDDATRIYEILDADDLISTKYITWVAGARSVEEIAARITEFDSQTTLGYGIFVEDRLAGYIGAHQHEYDTTSTEYDIGYFCDPAYRGQGLTPASTEHLMDLLVTHRAAESFALYIYDGNEPSQAVAKKLGFTRMDEVVTDEILGVDERRWEKTVQ